MRTTSYTEVTGLPKYEPVPPPDAKMLSQYLREQGYYTTNNSKEDYQFTPPKNAWDESGKYAHWRNRPADTPFFAVVNFTTTHESGLFEPYGFRYLESRHYFSDDTQRISNLDSTWGSRTVEVDTAIHVAKNLNFPIPPYLPDTPLVRRDMWKMYNNLAEVDRQMGAVLEQLKQDGLFDNTIIFFYSDHGGPLPRQKRLVYDSGLKVPLIIRYPHAAKAGQVDDQLVSFVDFAPTTLKLAGIEPPKNMHGQDFIQNGMDKREFIHAAADRFDGFTDVIRAVKNKRFKYIRNYRPDQGYYLPVEYREQIPTMQELLRLRSEEKLNAHQAQWFRSSKDIDELFDTIADPHELNNLAKNPVYADDLKTLSNEMDRWLAEVGDVPSLPERQLINKLWGGQDTKPITADPIIELKDGIAHISCATSGASLSYQIIQNNYDPLAWKIYNRPVIVPKGAVIKVVAQRIGFVKSATKRMKVN
jgi:arylsulfatase A-like enzyme